jgi:hypothetical protein
MQYKKIDHYQLILKFERKKKANWLGELGLGEIFLFLYNPVFCVFKYYRVMCNLKKKEKN